MSALMTVGMYLNAVEESEHIFATFERALHKEISQASLGVEDINHAIRQLQSAYRRISPNRQISSINYDCASYRAAYLYLYAGCHAAAVYSELTCLMYKYPTEFTKLMRYEMPDLHICSLGGGPGCDVLGLLHCRRINSKMNVTRSIRCTVVDLCMGWGVALQHVQEAYTAGLGSFREMVKFDFRQVNLCTGSPQLHEISTANIVSLVKYVSVVSYYYTKSPSLLETIFWRMKPGSYVFFLDNSAGGFYEMTSRAAARAGLLLVAQPIFHRWNFPSKYEFNSKYVSRSLRTTSVICAIWIKSGAEPLLRLPTIYAI
ncbi:uncharacterized protein LOC111627683 [Centruroides sculpturatus]|uniref:uncharacterized protein LOC111627683 n=1 Tax=Centruroides sculpturatus TaxID=218467 RepID=UPI000C6CDA01|nr:uncharacterized protein LOC111627683 [Centruroides sculpturatus]